MSDACARRDLVRMPSSRFLLWGLPAAVMLLTACFAGGGWIVTIAWTLSLVVMGAACLVNARSCGRMHCYFTGPFFLFMAALSLLHGWRVLSLGSYGWHFIAAVLLAGGVLLYFVPEWAWGRYRSTQTQVR